MVFPACITYAFLSILCFSEVVDCSLETSKNWTQSLHVTFARHKGRKVSSLFHLVFRLFSSQPAPQQPSRWHHLNGNMIAIPRSAAAALPRMHVPAPRYMIFQFYSLLTLCVWKLCVTTFASFTLAVIAIHQVLDVDYQWSSPTFDSIPIIPFHSHHRVFLTWR
ncbi:hypothetical protein B0H65DRAFT_180213 [Neurospora tetraspora]|uniref:Secreted protein n=1 Tax=Neurospora tetraspora TaxID=94610 RepID=A0AAE0MRG2_9PEZI|nr:hypothetical protein B0H65DRAFT_180213 [Neurospora tetraspora]